MVDLSYCHKYLITMHFVWFYVCETRRLNVNWFNPSRVSTCTTVHGRVHSPGTLGLTNYDYWSSALACNTVLHCIIPTAIVNNSVLKPFCDLYFIFKQSRIYCCLLLNVIIYYLFINITTIVTSSNVCYYDLVYHVFIF